MDATTFTSEAAYREAVADEAPSPILWDATPGVCCAAYQLGACPHTEELTDDDIAQMEAEWRRDFPEEAAAADAWFAAQPAPRYDIEEPF